MSGRAKAGEVIIANSYPRSSRPRQEAAPPYLGAGGQFKQVRIISAGMEFAEKPSLQKKWGILQTWFST